MRGAWVPGVYAVRRVATLAGLVLALVLFGAAGSACAVIPASSPGWGVESFASPTVFSGGVDGECVAQLDDENSPCDSYVVSAVDAGGAATDGSAVTLSDVLPSGVAAHGVELSLVENGNSHPRGGRTVVGGMVLDEGQLRELGYGVVCTIVPVVCRLSGGVVAPDDVVRMVVYVTVSEAGVGGGGALVNAVAVSGGGAPSVSARAVNPVGAVPVSFGVSGFGFALPGSDGVSDTRAGGHPYELRATVALNNVYRRGPGGGLVDTSVQDLKDLVIDLPLGYLAVMRAVAVCTFAQLDSATVGGGGCPPAAVVGHIETEPFGNTGLSTPLYNMVPEQGYPAELGYVDSLGSTHALSASVVPGPAGYVLRVSAADLPQVDLTRLTVTLYGDPPEKDGGGNPPFALLTNPSDCSGQPSRASVHLDSWQDPGTDDGEGGPQLSDPAWVTASTELPAVTGCEALAGLFEPSIVVVPQRAQGANPTVVEPNGLADSPTGLELELRSPSSEAPEGVATPPLRTAVVRLPEGITVDPSAADGLQACSPGEIGWLGPTGPGGEPLPNKGLTNFTAQAPACPEASKVGSLELTTPLFAGVLSGAIYLAAQNENPFNSILAAYAVIDDPATGVILKLPAELQADPRTGRLTVVLTESPQLPFSDLKLHFYPGPRALLATPENCGTYTTTSTLTSWSASEFEPTLNNFTIDEGCTHGFAPSFTALSTNAQAGAYTPFQVSVSREDSDQELDGWSVTLPPGLLADIGSVPLCTEAAANAGSGAGGCPENTRVGTVLAEAGPGPNPLSIPGKAYLTGPTPPAEGSNQSGGPFGLSIVVPVIAGPLNLGTVVVRQSLRIDPRTAQITVVSDPGVGGLPIIQDVTGANGQTDGIPIRLRRIAVTFERPGGAPFMFNPTSCAKLPLTGTVSSTQGASASVSSPFQMAGCAALGFKPRFDLSTSGRTSRRNGAGLHVKLVYPNGGGGGPGGIGSQANLAAVKVDLPKQLVSRLATLQGACPAGVFEQNPAACPASSRVGTAGASTPVLPGAGGNLSGRDATPPGGDATPPGRDINLIGPAYFVSHGGKRFPELILVLQGDGVTVDLSGETSISKAGITSSTFRTIPDVPVGTFELNLPEGPDSALAANGKLCQTVRTVTVAKRVKIRIHGHVRTVTRRLEQQVDGLVMPTALTAQDGAVIHQNTPIRVTGCPPPARPPARGGRAADPGP
jgi:hypothetical protein